MSRYTLDRIEAIRQRIKPACPTCRGEPVYVRGVDRAGNVVELMPGGTCPTCGTVARVEVHTPGVDVDRI